MEPLLAVLAACFAASTVHATVGFGTALVAMPVLLVALGIERATPVVGLAALTTQVVIFARTWRGMDVRAAARLLLASSFGIPIGIALIRFGPPDVLKALLGATLVLYAGWSLRRPMLPRIGWPHAIYPFGFVAGVLGGAFNTNAPPLVLYGALSRWTPEQFRATLSGYFLPTAIIVCLAHAGGGLWTREVIEFYAMSVPAIAIGNVCGWYLAKRIRVAQFTRLLYLILLLAGLGLMVN